MKLFCQDSYFMICVIVHQLVVSAVATRWELMSQGTYETMYNSAELELIQSKAGLAPIRKNENVSYLPVCTFGSGFYGADMLRDRQYTDQCMLRGVKDRLNGVHSLWGDKGFFNGYIDTLLLYLLHSNVTTVIFVGDSIAAQNAQSFICDVMRNSQYFHFPENTNYMTDSLGTSMNITYKHLHDHEKVRRLHSTQLKLNHKFSEVIDKQHGPSRTISIRNVRNGPEQCFIGVESVDECATLDKAIDRYYTLTKTKMTGLVTEYCNYLPESEKCVIMWNEGLHWHYNITRPYNSKGMTRALLEVAKAEKVLPGDLQLQLPSNSSSMMGSNITSHILINEQMERKHYLLYRETTAQCFNKKGGDYFGESYLSVVNDTRRFKPLCCVAPNASDAIQEQGWRNRDVVEVATHLDPLWRHYMGYIHIFNHTLKMCDLKVEQNPNEPPDCTHFVYTPTSFDILWYETYLAFYHLIHHRYPLSNEIV